MTNRKQPIDLIIAKGKKHLTKAEIERRRNEEINVPFTEIKPPKYLDTKQKKKFKEIAGKLQAVGIWTELDEDNLGRYLVAQDLYLTYTEAINQTIKENNLVLLKELQAMQDKAYRQAQTCARDLGLTISSRCKLVVPETKKEEPKKNKFSKFMKTENDTDTKGGMLA